MQQLQRAARSAPSFVLEDYFCGHTSAFGMFVDRFGAIRRQFSADIRGEFGDGQLVLTEDFSFDDGERSQRIWRITPLGDGRYSGTADDVIGTAEGTVAGNLLQWSYDLNLKIGQRDWRVHLQDIMLLQNDRILLNRARMSKWGITLGEVIISFEKETELSGSDVADGRRTERESRNHVGASADALAAVSA